MGYLYTCVSNSLLKSYNHIYYLPTYLLLTTYVVTSTLANTSPIQFVDAVIKRWMHSCMCGRSSKTDSDGHQRARFRETPVENCIKGQRGPEPFRCRPPAMGWHAKGAWISPVVDNIYHNKMTDISHLPPRN